MVRGECPVLDVMTTIYRLEIITFDEWMHIFGYIMDQRSRTRRYNNNMNATLTRLGLNRETRLRLIYGK
jgi:hypothetical protein